MPAEPRADQDVIRPWSTSRCTRRAISRSCAAISRPKAASRRSPASRIPSITGPARVFDSENEVMDAIMARQDQGRRRRRDPLRRPEGRSRHAGDARADVRADRAGPRRIGRAHHRRPLLRRHVGHGRRARRARGVRRRHDRARRGRRFDHDRRAQAARPAQRRRRGARAAPRAVEAAGAALHARAAGEVHAPRVDREQGRDHRYAWTDERRCRRCERSSSRSPLRCARAAVRASQPATSRGQRRGRSRSIALVNPGFESNAARPARRARGLVCRPARGPASYTFTLDTTKPRSRRHAACASTTSVRSRSASILAEDRRGRRIAARRCASPRGSAPRTRRATASAPARSQPACDAGRLSDRAA